MYTVMKYAANAVHIADAATCADDGTSRFSQNAGRAQNVALDTLVDTLVSECIIDMNYGGILPLLLSKLKESYLVSKAATLALFLNSQKGLTNQKCIRKAIFTPAEEEKYLKQRRTIADWFKGAHNHSSRGTQRTGDVTDLRVLMDYTEDFSSNPNIAIDDYWNRIIESDDIYFPDSEGESPKKDASNYRDDMSTCSTAIDSRCITQEDVSQTNAKMETSYDVKMPSKDIKAGLGSHITGSEPLKTTDSRSKAVVENTLKRDQPLDHVVHNHTGNETKDYGTQNATYENSYTVDVTPKEEEIGGILQNQFSEDGNSNITEIKQEMAPELPQQPSFYVNTSVIVYGYANVTVQCLYIIKQVLGKCIWELLANSEHMQKEYTFVLSQNNWMQRICCMKLSVAFYQQEITFDKLGEILINKKSRCCFLENFDLLQPEVQLMIGKYLHKNERLFIISAQRISYVISFVRNIAFNFKTAPLNVGRLVDAMTDGRFYPNIFTGMPRVAIMELAHRARDSIHVLYSALLAITGENQPSCRRNTFIFKRLAHCVSFQEKSLSSEHFIKKTVLEILPIYQDNPNMFWLDLMEELETYGSPHFLASKPLFYHLIAERSTSLAQTTEHQYILENTFLEMMDIVRKHRMIAPM